VNSVTEPARLAFERLRDGNRRFAQGLRSVEALVSHVRRGQGVEGQAPFAIVLGCSDSRVPAELVFDQGLGALFVIRVAGNIVASSQIGSVEFAADAFQTRLVVVLGHTHCGAVDKTLEVMRGPEPPASRGIAAIVERIRPLVPPLLGAHPELSGEELAHALVHANVRESVHQLRTGSAILGRLQAEEGLVIIGAHYDIASGQVEFFDGVPEGWEV
jgi:carbonic anhydrase